MFVVIYTYTKPLNEVDALRAAHLAFLDKEYAAGHFVVSGRQNPPVGGILISQVHSVRRWSRLCGKTHTLLTGLPYQIIEFMPAKYAAGFAPFLNVQG